MAYFGKLSKQISWKKITLLRLSNSCFFFFFFSIRVFFLGWGDIYLELCMWDDYHIFLIASLVFTRLLLNDIYHLIELPFWLIDDVTLSVCLFTWLFDSSFFVIAIWVGKPVDSNLHRLFITLQVNRLTKCASHLKTTTSLDSFEFVLWNV